MKIFGSDVIPHRIGSQTIGDDGLHGKMEKILDLVRRHEYNDALEKCKELEADSSLAGSDPQTSLFIELMKIVIDYEEVRESSASRVESLISAAHSSNAKVLSKLSNKLKNGALLW